MKCKMAGAKARFVLQTLLARHPEGTPSRALVTKRFQLSFSPSCEVGPFQDYGFFINLTTESRAPFKTALMQPVFGNDRLICSRKAPWRTVWAVEA